MRKDTQSDSQTIWDQTCARLGQQQWPSPALYVVATPIGNLADFTPRAWYALKHADVVAAEDTRATRVLLDAWQIQADLISVHRHNERERYVDILERLASGQRVALVSDAGAPGVSDPGGHVIQAARAAGYPVVALPGASSVIATLMTFGTTTDDHPGFVFLGFLPAKSGARRKVLARWADYDGTLIAFEAPHRIQSCLQDLQTVFGDERQVGLARELTKRFEETAMMPLRDARQWLEDGRHRNQGEFVLLIAPQAAQASEAAETVLQLDAGSTRWVNALLERVSTRDAARIMAQVLEQPRDVCYDWLLTRSKGRDAGHDTD